MPGPWFLFLVFVHAANVMIEEVSTVDIWDKSPSCEELRTMWNTISRLEKPNELANEIPLVPFWELSSNPMAAPRHRNLEKGRRKQVRYPPLVQQLMANAIEDTAVEHFPSPHSQISPPVEPLFVVGPQSGHFGDFSGEEIFHDDVAPLGITRKKGGGENVLSSWGLPEEVGMFGKFVDFDAEYPLAGDRQSDFRSPSLHSSQEPCFQVLNKDCTVNEQCICTGWNDLQCFHGKCSNQQLRTETENEHGSWHDGPLPRSKLGRQKRPRRNRETTFM